jgi:deoxycytidylate deaminase
LVSVALSNRHPFHVVALLWRGKTLVRVATNSTKTHPKYRRVYPTSGKEGAHLHAEMALLTWARPGDRVDVIRFLANGTPTMARPCPFCQRHLRAAGISCIRYTDWDGNLQTL